MTEDGRLDPRILNAFADGELEPEDAARVVMHLADCPADQQAVDAIMAMNALLARACEGPLHEPVPPAIRAAILGPAAAAPAPVAAPASVAPRPRFARGRGWRLPGGWRLATAGAGVLAAALAMAVILLPQADGPALALGPVAPRSPMAGALDELASGEARLVAGNTELAVIASFAVAGGYCREFALRHDTDEDLIALACTEAGGWHVTARLAAADPSPAAGYVPAGEGRGEPAGDPIGAQLDARGAGLPLTPAEEAAAAGAGWR